MQPSQVAELLSLLSQHGKKQELALALYPRCTDELNYARALKDLNEEDRLKVPIYLSRIIMSRRGLPHTSPICYMYGIPTGARRDRRAVEAECNHHVTTM